MLESRRRGNDVILSLPVIDSVVVAEALCRWFGLCRPGIRCIIAQPCPYFFPIQWLTTLADVRHERVKTEIDRTRPK